MATLVLTAVGTAIGGPLGGALGAIAGQQIDQNILFKPKGREAPRLQDLAIQTSSYGSQIPRIFGRMRVAGTVVWATDLKETRTSQGGGKRRPSTQVYSYSACFAVALSSPEVRQIGRIWADGKLLRGSRGDFKTPCTFRFLPGSEDQQADGFIASAESGGATPAYRGLALAIFEDMELADYGNRIPSLTFEIIADDGAVGLAHILDDISHGRIKLESGEMVVGYSASGEDQRTALAALTESIPMSFSCDPEAIDQIAARERHVDQAGIIAVTDEIFVRASDGDGSGQLELQTLAENKAPRLLSLRYYDPSRDFQAGMQNAFRGGQGRAIFNRDLPAAISASDAKKLAAQQLWTFYQERAVARIQIVDTSLILDPGATVQISDMPGFWRVRNRDIARGFSQVQLSRVPGLGDLVVAADHGRAVPDSDQLAGMTRLALVDLPFAMDAPTQPSAQPRLYMLGAGDAGWRKAEVFRADANGDISDFVGNIPAPSVMGKTLNRLGDANPTHIDRLNSIIIDLHNDSMRLSNADDERLLAGDNIAMIGTEIIQFAEAAPISGTRYRLSRMIRGLGCTEGETGNHLADEDFVMLDASTTLELDPVHYDPFVEATFFALGRDDPEPVPATHMSPGRALLPWSPVHPRSYFSSDGDLEIRWTRRSRAGLVWADHVEVPIAEESEKYRLVVASDLGNVIETSAPWTVIAADQIQQFRDAEVEQLQIHIHQLGRHGQSKPCLISITL
ncbi:hypothetical protein A8B75_12005 [Sphingomonadales bacterium EhC05]|nr:hypothetical protein A8B75_12005 [Sphingomonadales bacterium EhC05]